MSKFKIYPTLHFNEEKTAVTLVVVSTMPIAEDEFVAALYDWLKAHKDGFQYESVGELVEFDMMIDEEYDGSPKH